MQDYKQLKVWVKAHQLTLMVYAFTKDFPKQEQYGLTNQLRRAAVSIAANIAEGSGKKTKNDFARFLNIALGSANETEYYLILAKDLDYLPTNCYMEASGLINEVKAMLISLVGKVREGGVSGK